jgi:hypothetical protein
MTREQARTIMIQAAVKSDKRVEQEVTEKRLARAVELQLSMNEDQQMEDE